MSIVLPQYPFDPTGLAPSNLVTETQTIQSRGMFDHYYVVPQAAPFFSESMRLRLYPIGANVNNPSGGRLLEEGVDYNFGYHFAYASHTIGKPVYAAISFYDRALAGQLRMEYQTLGAEWVLDAQSMTELLANVAYNPRITTWEHITELPREFPVVNHDFSVDDFVGMGEVVDQLDEITEAILQSNEGGLGDHVEDKSNPHTVTKDQVGLGLVDNYPTAAPAEATAGLANNRFMTPLRTKQLIDAVAIAALTLHMSDLANPHAVTKVQVGLSNVQNYAVANQAESEAGASNARFMTPLRTREAIEAIVGVVLTAHLSSLTNPHQVTKAQVGLGNVQNIGVATDQAALQGVDDSGVITPRVLAYVLNETVGAGVTDHIGADNNPHNVTKLQTGLGLVENYPPASEAEARDATASDRYMTPLAVRQAINQLVGDSSNAHVTDFANPHAVTAAQVGTYDQAQIDALLELRVGVAEAAFDSDRLFGMDQGTLESWIGTLTVGNATKLNGSTYAETKADILASQSADSAKLDGKTYEQLVTEISGQVAPSDTRLVVPATIVTIDGEGIVVPTPMNWVKMGVIKASGLSGSVNLTLMLTGGRTYFLADEKHSTCVLEVSADYREIDEVTGDLAFAVNSTLVTHLSREDSTLAFGYTVTGINATAEIAFYVKAPGHRESVVISELSDGLFTLQVDDVENGVYFGDMLLEEPAGIVYPEVNSVLLKVDDFATATTQETIDGVAGDLFTTPAGVTALVGVLCDELISAIDDSLPLFV